MIILPLSMKQCTHTVSACLVLWCQVWFCTMKLNNISKKLHCTFEAFSRQRWLFLHVNVDDDLIGADFDHVIGDHL